MTNYVQTVTALVPKIDLANAGKPWCRSSSSAVVASTTRYIYFPKTILDGLSAQFYAFLPGKPPTQGEFSWLSPPWHSARESDRNVYYINDKCTEGNQIPRHNHKSGTDSRPHCEECSKLA